VHDLRPSVSPPPPAFDLCLLRSLPFDAALFGLTRKVFGGVTTIAGHQGGDGDGRQHDCRVRHYGP
jgi:hypothetical protein